MKDKRCGLGLYGCVADFRIKPEPPKRWFFTVKIFDDVKAIKRYLDARPWMGSLGKHGVAMCMTWKAQKPSGHYTGECGEIVYPLTYFTPEVIAHECTHAALSWAKRIGIDPLSKGVCNKRGIRLVSADNERFTEALGQMVEQVFVRASRYGVFDDAE